MLMATIQNTMAGVMLPASKKSLQKVTVSNEIRLGGTIGKIDEDGAEINATYYPFQQASLRVHDFAGKVTNVSALKSGMLVSFKVVQESQSIKISEIWVIRNE